ncbi:MAG: flagellar hook protein FlgE [Bacteriovoracaceae bacterium]|nr:flagellar hook protein FlgE [Bacteriovoracaceae bacterium]
MSILGAFNVGVSGLAAAGGGMTIIGDNISNAGTTGFKASRAEFQDVLATSLKGIDGGDQFGAGTKLAHIKAMYTQGNISRTDNVTDLAINGDGFFPIDAPFGRGFSRDGSFHFDKEGFLVTSDSYKVLGFQANEEGEITTKMDPLRLGSTHTPAIASSEVEMMMNLDSREMIKEFNLEKPDKTSSFSNAVTVYDNVGAPRLVTLYFNKAENNKWNYHAVVDGKDAEGGTEGKLIEMATGTMQFNDKGQLNQVIEGNNSFNFNKGAAPGQKINFTFGKTMSEGGTGINLATQYGSDSSVSRHTQDGTSAATLTSLSFNDHGILTAVYNNGTSKNLGQMAVAKFENNEGLFKVGKNLMKSSRSSGQAAYGKPVEGGRGEVLSKSIELSNVDLASEFVALMTTQRNFQANAKTIKTADQMLEEVINIKR